jgi:hypothetical protein
MYYELRQPFPFEQLYSMIIAGENFDWCLCRDADDDIIIYMVVYGYCSLAMARTLARRTDLIRRLAPPGHALITALFNLVEYFRPQDQWVLDKVYAALQASSYAAHLTSPIHIYTKDAYQSIVVTKLATPETAREIHHRYPTLTHTCETVQSLLNIRKPHNSLPSQKRKPHETGPSQKRQKRDSEQL